MNAVLSLLVLALVGITKVLYATALPEPAKVLFLGATLVVVALWVRRRRSTTAITRAHERQAHRPAAEMEPTKNLPDFTSPA
jgi:hypothetical protein